MRSCMLRRVRGCKLAIRFTTDYAPTSARYRVRTLCSVHAVAEATVYCFNVSLPLPVIFVLRESGLPRDTMAPSSTLSLEVRSR